MGHWWHPFHSYNCRSRMFFKIMLTSHKKKDRYGIQFQTEKVVHRYVATKIKKAMMMMMMMSRPPPSPRANKSYLGDDDIKP